MITLACRQSLLCNACCYFLIAWQDLIRDSFLHHMHHYNSWLIIPEVHPTLWTDFRLCHPLIYPQCYVYNMIFIYNWSFSMNIIKPDDFPLLFCQVILNLMRHNEKNATLIPTVRRLLPQKIIILINVIWFEQIEIYNCQSGASWRRFVGFGVMFAPNWNKYPR